MRYYIPTDKVKPSFKASGSLGLSNYKMESDLIARENKYKYSNMSFAVGTGIAVAISEKLTFDVIAGYNYQTTKARENGDHPFQKNISGIFEFKVGFVVFLREN